MDQAVIERENAPAVTTGAAAVAEYASQVLEQFMENRPEVGTVPCASYRVCSPADIHMRV